MQWCKVVLKAKLLRSLIFEKSGKYLLSIACMKIPEKAALISIKTFYLLLLFWRSEWLKLLFRDRHKMWKKVYLLLLIFE